MLNWILRRFQMQQRVDIWYGRNGGANSNFFADAENLLILSAAK